MSIELATPTFSNEQICAHRGASGSYPENTRAAFDAAASVGAGWIETDIQCLADGELVIFHDDHLGRTASGSAKVTLLSWPDMAGLDIGGWKGDAFASERPLRCEDLIAWQAETSDRPGIVWEVKCAITLRRWMPPLRPSPSDSQISVIIAVSSRASVAMSYLRSDPSCPKCPWR